nr:PREDICTED: single-stranded DNA-binding protein, mitochondrial isoform X1 [Bemisia tabaci]
MFSQTVYNLILKGRPCFRNQFVRSFCSPVGSNVEKSINEVRLLGRVGAEPEKRGSEEHPVVTFQLATDTSYRNSAGEITQKTEWHRIAVFRPKLRDTVYDYLQKGKRVYVAGRISYGSMTTESGSTVNLCSIIADDIIFLHS